MNQSELLFNRILAFVASSFHYSAQASFWPNKTISSLASSSHVLQLTWKPHQKECVVEPDRGFIYCCQKMCCYKVLSIVDRKCFLLLLLAMYQPGQKGIRAQEQQWLTIEGITGAVARQTQWKWKYYCSLSNTMKVKKKYLLLFFGPHLDILVCSAVNIKFSELR